MEDKAVRPKVVDLPSALDEISYLEKEVRSLRSEKRILAIALITAGFVLLIFSYVTEKVFRQSFPAKPVGVSAPASSVAPDAALHSAAAYRHLSRSGSSAAGQVGQQEVPRGK